MGDDDLVSIPAMAGVPRVKAETMLRVCGFVPVIDLTKRTGHAPGLVVASSPAAGSLALRGSPVVLVVTRDGGRTKGVT